MPEKMTKDELIVELCSLLMSSERDKAIYKKSLDEIHFKLVCVGGPLNDNLLKFNGPQLVLIAKIDDLTEV